MLGGTAFNLAGHRRILGGGGPRGPRPPFFLYFQNVLPFCFENRFIKCSLILSSETLTLLYFASRIRPQCCMLHVLKSEVSIRQRRGGGRWGTRPPLSEISGSAPAEAISGTHVRSDRERESCCRVSYLELTFAFLPEIAFGTCHSVTVNP